MNIRRFFPLKKEKEIYEIDISGVPTSTLVSVVTPALKFYITADWLINLMFVASKFRGSIEKDSFQLFIESFIDDAAELHRIVVNSEVESYKEMLTEKLNESIKLITETEQPN